MQTIHVERMPSPIGTVLILTDDQDRLRAVDFDEHEDRLHRLLVRYCRPDRFKLIEGRPTSPARRALEAYFAGDLSRIGALPTETGGTAFQRDVWAALRKIRPGWTMSYGELAARIGRANAVRAVGLANGSNPIAIVVPCHRVIGADGSLTGYGGGLPRKRWLLEHEGVDLSGRSRPSFATSEGEDDAGNSLLPLFAKQ
jgi:methylated-DNA-[protein]-cysteine S-methyltransferase